MRRLTNNEFNIIKSLVTSTQGKLLKNMRVYLESKYDKVIATKDYIVAIGDIPIALVAHLDTVFISPVKNLYYDQKEGVLWSPEGLGADDRAGVFAITQILKTGLRPSVIFTTDEERGGVGASILASFDCPIPNLKYIIELDRRGIDDCVFYDCGTKDFIAYIESFGFTWDWGSFSDISFLCPAWDVCGVNLSIGYQNEHSEIETLHIEYMFNTIDKVITMLSEPDIPDFKYEEISYRYSNYWNGYNDFDFGYNSKYYSMVQPTEELLCSCCQRDFLEFELIPIKGKDGKTKFLCADCFSEENISWCKACNEGFEITDAANINLCPDCVEAKKKNEC